MKTQSWNVLLAMTATTFAALIALSGCASGMQGSTGASAATNTGSGSTDQPPPATTPPAPVPTPVTMTGFDLKAQVDHFDQVYRLHDAYTKLVDNTGNGFDALYGVRNFRAVLTGVYYRGGANNSYNVNLKRSNENPLEDGGIENLCEQGFGEAIYLYDTNYKTAPPTMKCRTTLGEDSMIEYNQVDGLTAGNEIKLLTRVYNHIKGKSKGPMYAHCWNGWHASGFVAAITLRQFCGWTATEADSYWVKNTDGNNVGASYDAIRARIRAFTSHPELAITAEERALICPTTK